MLNRELLVSVRRNSKAYRGGARGGRQTREMIVRIGGGRIERRGLKRESERERKGEGGRGREGEREGGRERERERWAEGGGMSPISPDSYLR